MAVRLHKLLPHRIRQSLHHTLCKIPYYCKYVSNRRLKKRQKHLPKPLAPRMEHQNLSSIAIDPSTNANCLFLTMLPPELRLQIYTEVFSDPKFSNCVTVHTHGHLYTFPLCCCHLEPVLPFPHLHLLSLPKTCRQIYIESLPSLYTLHSFRPATLSTVATFSRSLLPSRLSLIRHLKLSLHFCYPLVLYRDPLTNLTLDETWDIVASQMTGLRDLEVCILLHSHTGEWEAGEKMVLSGLGRCSGLAAFKVKVVHLGGHYGETQGVNESVEASRWREELTRRVMRPRVAAGEMEDTVGSGEGEDTGVFGESEEVSSVYAFHAGVMRARRHYAAV